MSRLPLSALLSQVLVAFLIECDNELEHRIPHRTTDHGRTPGTGPVPWLVSMTMWSNFLRHVPSEGITATDLRAQVAMPAKDLRLWATRLSKWWGYLAVDQPANSTAKAPAVVRWTPGGWRAREVWLTLPHQIEARWCERFGRKGMQQLRKALEAAAAQLADASDDSMPILGYGLCSKVKAEERHGQQQPRQAGSQSLDALLSRILLAFTVEFEHESELALAACANLLRLLETDPVATRDLPARAGVSKAAMAMLSKLLEKRGYVKQLAKPAGRGKVVFLTAKGRRACEHYLQSTASIEKRWAEKFGAHTVAELRAALEALVLGEDGDAPSPLMRCLSGYPEGWRSSLPGPQALPHFPMILHRGGFPDGS